MQCPSISLVCSGIFLGYILYSMWTLSELFVPPSCKTGDHCITPFLKSNPKLQLLLYTSVKSAPTSDNDVILLDNQWNFDINTPREKELNIVIPQQTRQNGSLFLHLYLLPQQKNKWHFPELIRERTVAKARIRLTQYQVPEAAAFNLLSASSINEPSRPIESSMPTARDQKHFQPVTHLKSRVSFNIMTDNVDLPRTNLPPEIARLLVLTSNWEYLPIIQYDFLNNRLRDLVEVTSNDSNMNITLRYSPIGIGRLRLFQQVEVSMRTLMDIGFTSKDVDEVKGIFADTNLYLLCATIFISSIHLLFDFLALKNDVSFWQRQQNLVGLSSRTVLWRAFSQFVVFLYLWDENSSLLVLLPTGIGVIIEAWKVMKVLQVSIVLGSYYIPHFQFTTKTSSLAEQRTKEFDAESMRYLSYILYPLCFGGAIYSLLYIPHRSWYSWSINSLVKGVYAFGFLFMLPQLFVNYKLKSVAHLPWRSFMYKAFNTFIDDLFAFIITMPTAHRVACFRDDIVFLVYLYQRWLYPVDKTRRDEDVLPIGEEEDKKTN